MDISGYPVRSAKCSSKDQPRMRNAVQYRVRHNPTLSGAIGYCALDTGTRAAKANQYRTSPHKKEVQSHRRCFIKEPSEGASRYIEWTQYGLLRVGCLSADLVGLLTLKRHLLNSASLSNTLKHLRSFMPSARNRRRSSRVCVKQT